MPCRPTSRTCCSSAATRSTKGPARPRADFERPYLDYLYKWYLWYWAYRDLTAEIPAVTIPDDHDVFHGNVWGAGGRATPPGLTGAAAQDAGGYKLPAAWVNMVQRTQTSHLPRRTIPATVDQGIGVYYTDLLYGGVSFAVIEDRKFKSAPGASASRRGCLERLGAESGVRRGTQGRSCRARHCSASGSLRSSNTGPPTGAVGRG